ncbi:MAG: CotH kinase family protein, partial [Phycisphaerae bacterium]|nr:CotH kinase family protein [Phycisphaerae bacterium]
MTCVRTSHSAVALFESLEPRLLLSGSVVISEFMASNDATILDGDGNSSDWIELHNLGASPVNINGWFLTDKTGNLDKWEIPNLTLAASGDPWGNDYLLIFASGQDDADYPYWDGAHYHTNFELSKGGENVLLVEDDGSTIVHSFVDYPAQVTDVSYGFYEGAALNTLVDAGDSLTYHIPTPGDAPLLPAPNGGWTAEGFDDSTWSHETYYGAETLLVTEINTGDTDYVEIQNVYHSPVDVTGWMVLVNDPAVGPSAVNSVAWNLTGTMDTVGQAGNVLHRDDTTWGSDIAWELDGSGWAMILDNLGQVVDFLPWGYDAAEIEGMSIDYGAYTGIIPSDYWTGDGAEAGAGAGAGGGGAGGPGINYSGGVYSENFDSIGTGSTTAPTGWTAGNYSSVQNNQPPGGALDNETLSPADGSSVGKGFSYNYGSGFASDRAIGHLPTTSTGDRGLQIEITNDTGSAIESFTLGYTGEQWRDWQSGANPPQQLSVWFSTSPGSGFVSMGSQFDFIAPHQTGANGPLDGNDPANRQNINAGYTPSALIEDGETFYITWHDVNDSGISDNPLAVDDVTFSAVFGPREVLARSGNFDTDSGNDFRRHNTPGPGVENDDITAPFGTSVPNQLGAGFSNEQDDFEAITQTDVSGPMKEINASIWTRIEFEVGDLSAYSDLMLRMKYDDGFVAYLNGTEIVSQNAPATLATDSTALGTRSNAQAIIYQDFIVPLGLLHTGTNVLAINGLNVDAFDDDFLLQPQLVATSTVSDPRFFGNPTPEAMNDPSLGAPADAVEFSRLGGTFTETSFTVSLSTASSDTTIYYTLNGALPSESSTPYTGPLTISNTTQIRARAYEPGRAPGPVNTESYIGLAADIQAYSTDIPIFVIENFGAGGVPANTKQVSHVSVFEPGANGWAFVNGAHELETRAGLKTRGSSTSGQSFAFETWDDEINDDHNVSPLGLPSESDWILYSSGYDKSKMNNTLMYSLANQTGQYAVRTRHVAYFLNTGGGDVSMSDYKGVFVLMEKIKRGSDRVDVEELGPEDNTEPDISGGYMFKIDRADPGDGGFSAGNTGLKWVYPKEEVIELPEYNAQESWIKNYLNEYYAALTGPGFVNPSTGLHYSDYIDVATSIDFHILNEFSKNPDEFRLSTYMYKPRDGKFSFGPLWDFDRALGFEGRSSSPTGWWQDFRWGQWWSRMFNDSEFSQAWIDRWFELRRGVFSDANLQNTIDTQAAIIDYAAQNKDGNWSTHRNNLKNWVANRAAWMDSQFRPLTRYSISDGQVALGADVTLSAAGGAPIYYTTDGTDPRAVGGGIQGQLYDGTPITITGNTKIIARVYDAAATAAQYCFSQVQWGAPSELVAVVDTPADATNLAITEIHYNPQDPTPGELAADPTFTSEDFEFVEIINTSPSTIALGGVKFVDGFEFEFDGAATLSSMQRGVVVANHSAFIARYGGGITILGQYGLGYQAPHLSNTGEGIAITDVLGADILNFRFNDAGSWPGRADGKGASLEIIDPAGDYNDSDNWLSSVAYGGTPGSAAEGAIGVIINEVLSHTDLPDVDSIELYNTTGETVDLSGWYISDTWGWSWNPDNGDYKKFEIPAGISIGAGEYLVFDENDFGGVGPLDFALDGAHGDDVWLMKTDGSGKLTHFVDHVSFVGSFNGESFGRWPDTVGDLYPMTSVTLDGPNSSPRIGPVIISEVMYYPGIFHEKFTTGGSERFTEVAGVWSVSVGRYGVTPASIGDDTVATIDLPLALPIDYVLQAEIKAVAAAGGYASNAMLIFDYQSPTNFKFAGASVSGAQWRIGHRNSGGWIVDASLGAAIQADTNYALKLSVQNDIATLSVDGEALLSHEFIGVLNDGSLGVGTDNAVGSFDKIAVEPYAESDLEFIELYNPTGLEIELAAWKSNPHPETPGQYFADWRLRGGVEMEFDEGATIPAGGSLVVLAFDPAKPENASRVDAFRTHYGIDASVPLAGGYSGNLDNGGQRITLQRPDSPPADEPGYVPHMIEDEVVYDDIAPWPITPDGDGESLHRIHLALFGNDAASWLSDAPSPGLAAAFSTPPVVVDPIDDFSIDEDSSDTVIDLAAVFDDPDEGDTLTLLVSGNTNAGLVSTNVVGDILTLSYVADQNGAADITIRAIDPAGVWIEDAFTVTVDPINDAPTVASPISDVRVNEDVADTVIDLASAFDDADFPLDTLVFSVTINTNSGLVATNVVGSDLTLSYAADQTGSSDITVRATDQGGAGLWVEDTFNVIVDPVNDAPEAVNPVADFAVEEDASGTTIDLSSVFDDVDPGDTLTYQVMLNTNSGLVATGVVGSDLTLSYIENQNGSADITVRATDSAAPALFAEDTFTVTVDPVNDVPTVTDPVADVSVFENDSDTVVGASAVFSDADAGDTLTLSIEGNTNPDLVTVSLNVDELTLSYAADQSGSADITIRATDSGAPGLWVEDTFTVTVHPNNLAPVVSGEIADVTVNTGADDTVMYLSDVFDDSAGMRPTLDYTVIEIDPVTGAQTAGSGLFLYTFTLYGNDGVESVFATTTLTFTGAIQQTKAFGNIDINDGMTAATFEGIAGSGYIAGLDTWIFAGWQEIAPSDTSLTGSPVVLSVGSGTAEYFEQKDLVQIVAAGDVQWTGMHARLGADYPTSGAADANRLVYSVSNNTNPGLVTASVVGAQLTLDYSPGGSGVADITIRATDPDGAWVEDTFTVTVESSSEVVGRHVFYNNSSWDAGGDDNQAVAPDKTPLLPGGSVTASNYTSYSRGINGIMVDIAGMTGTPKAGDFIIKVNASDDPDTWSAGPAPTVSVHPGEGFGGSDRVKLIWP